MTKAVVTARRGGADRASRTAVRRDGEVPILTR
jgi:hypothetical protein